jgi:hypothetical protein
LDAGTIAVVFYIAILLMAATVAVLTVIYTMKPRSSRTASGPNSGGGAHEEKTPVETTQRQAESNETVGSQAGKIEAPLNREPVKAESTTQAQLPAEPKAKTIKPIRRRIPRVNMKIKLRKGAKDKVTQVEPNEAITDERVPSPAALKGDNVSPPESSPSAKPPTLSESPVSEVPHNLPLDIPNPEPKANNAVSAANDETHKTELEKKEPESHMDAKQPTTELAKSSSEQTLALLEAVKPAPQEPSKTGTEEPRERKAPAGDLSELFSKDTVEEDQASKLAEEMNDVDVKNLLEEGLSLVSRLKKTKG